MVAYLRARSREHRANMERIMSNMTLHSAVETLSRSGNLVDPEIIALAGGASLVEQRQQGNLRASSTPEDKGYGGLDKAKDLLNTMLEEVMQKYDVELDRCCDFEKMQSMLIEESRQDISFFGAEAAEARELILDAQQQIEACELKLPKLKMELQQHEENCKEVIGGIRAELKTVLADISVMSAILNMTDCDTTPATTGKKLLLLSCQDECTGESFITFHDGELGRASSALQSKAAQQLLQEGLSATDDADLDLSQADDDGSRNVTKPTEEEIDVEPPVFVPRSSPCKQPKVSDKRASKCSIKNNPSCLPLQERFLLIQAGIKDKKDELQEELNHMEKDCSDGSANFRAMIDDFESRLKDQQTKLASATQKLSVSNEQMRLKDKEFKKLKSTWGSETTTCHGNYENFESQMCGLKKIRGELYKMKGGDFGSILSGLQRFGVGRTRMFEIVREGCHGANSLHRDPSERRHEVPSAREVKRVQLPEVPNRLSNERLAGLE
eukprot:TRINITY_DN26760_c0_g1_i1.p1 TRINITY_DN26760_c0_g1~~TRINITY_DN26760_c0_g1_i1.p1  ORF type:complete len:551 (-),score=138.06 TRINITY_DN26760_c0_g1_i1:1105-2598(-)